MACCGTSCGNGCGGGYGGGYGGHGGFGGAGGSIGELIDVGCDKQVCIDHQGCTLIYEPPFMHGNGDFRTRCYEICAADCCRHCDSGSFNRGGRGGRGGRGNSPGLLVQMQQEGCHVCIPKKFLCSSYQCADVTSSCADSCCGPC